ncbi:uncharacterized protein LOC106157506 [Lingula anatina]|nr:uncharacterized protein LOC106157506 [Lingula anatina]|eukprot:XP_013388640.1 uncharacterized protein LOC106157506 [Lingula anatina]
MMKFTCGVLFIAISLTLGAAAPAEEVKTARASRSVSSLEESLLPPKGICKSKETQTLCDNCCFIEAYRVHFRTSSEGAFVRTFSHCACPFSQCFDSTAEYGECSAEADLTGCQACCYSTAWGRSTGVNALNSFAHNLANCLCSVCKASFPEELSPESTDMIEGDSPPM